MILLAPILFAAAIYMFLGRIIRATGFPQYSMVRPSWLTGIFVFGDIFCFFVQAVGAIILTTSNTSKGVNRGKTIVLVGLILQIAIFGFFVATALVFHIRARKAALTKRVLCDWDWEKYLGYLYVVSAIITTRNIYRVVEYVLGGTCCHRRNVEYKEADRDVVNGYLMDHEWALYIFDALLMASVLALTSMWYIGKKLVQDNRHENLEMTS